MLIICLSDSFFNSVVWLRVLFSLPYFLQIVYNFFSFEIKNFFLDNFGHYFDIIFKMFDFESRLKVIYNVSCSCLFVITWGKILCEIDRNFRVYFLWTVLCFGCIWTIRAWKDIICWLMFDCSDSNMRNWPFFCFFKSLGFWIFLLSYCQQII